MPVQIADPIASAWRRVFDRRAPLFDKVAFLPREIAERMTQRLDYIKLTPNRILDAGCGTGSDLRALSERYPAAYVTGADFSSGMLQRARTLIDAAPTSGAGRWLPNVVRRAFVQKRIGLVQTDFAALPFAGDTFDMVWSNLALQWHALPDQVFPEWQRILAVGGLLMFSTLGPDTLKELRAAWIAADAERLGRLKARGEQGGQGAQDEKCTPPAPRRPAVLDFVDMHDFGDMLVASGFELPVMDMERLTVTYRDPEALLADVRGWGAFPLSPGAGQPAFDGLTGRGAHRALIDALERGRGADGLLSLTFEIVYGHAWKAAPRAEMPSIVRVEDIGGRRARRSGDV